jgi:hypothetical protein
MAIIIIDKSCGSDTVIQVGILFAHCSLFFPLWDNAVLSSKNDAFDKSLLPGTINYKLKIFSLKNTIVNFTYIIYI